MLGEIPSQESFEREDLEILQDDVSMMTTIVPMMTTIVKRIKKNAAGRHSDTKLMQILRENGKILLSITGDESNIDTHL